MKKIILLLMFIPVISVFSQKKDISLNFQVNEAADVYIGKSWNKSYEDIGSPFNVYFDGKTLKITYESGTNYLSVDVISYTHNKKSKSAYSESESYTLKVERNSIIQYIIIEKVSTIAGNFNEIKIPRYSENGELTYYTYYRESEF